MNTKQPWGGGLQAVACVWLLAACTAEAPGLASSLADLGINDGASQGQLTTASVKPDEAATLELATRAKVEVPIGAVSATTEMTFKRPADAEALPMMRTLAPDAKPGSAPYFLEPTVTVFGQGKPSLSLPIAEGRDPQKLTVMWLADTTDRTWKPLGRPLVTAGLASIELPHAGIFMLVEQPTSSTEARDWSALVAEKLTECGLVATTGPLSSFISDSASGAGAEEWRCWLACILAADCSVVGGKWCADRDATGSVACLSACRRLENPFTCSDGSEVERCDGRDQCPDLADEDDCPPGTHFFCGNGERIPARERCDGWQDCSDDEDDCPPGAHFFCGDGERIPGEWQCDGWDACWDGSDEEGCPPGMSFVCSDGVRILAAQQCDLYVDCTDGSDEVGCLTLTCEQHDPRNWDAE